MLWVVRGEAVCSVADTTEVTATEGNGKIHQKTNGQQAPEKVFNTSNDQGDANQTTTVSYHLTWVRMAGASE